MKIILIDEFIYGMGGVERIVNTLANNLINSYKIEVISVYKNSKEPFFNYRKEIKIKYLIKDYKLFDENNNFLHYLNRAITIIKDKLFLQKRIKRELKNIEETDIIIFGRVGTALMFLPYIKKLKLKNKIIVRDGLNLICYNEKTKKNIKKYFLNNVKYFIVSSDESIKEYEEFFGVNNKIIIKKIYNPIGIIPKQCYNFKNKRIISVGRLHSQKGFDQLILAFAQSVKLHSDWKLEIYGDGQMHDELLKLIEKTNMKENIFLKPSSRDIVEIYKGASLFICTSRYEGYANALVEAGTCGLPLISYNWKTGVDEIISNNKNGLVVKLNNNNDYYNNINNIKDIDNLSNAINRLIENEELCNKFSRNNYTFFDNRKLYNILNEWRKIIENE